ncbi:MAG: hypothetical protein KGJ23_01050 [Euryarchaeota archaeon]|nr:hypothetical protein [Euryarchaeota archaeon]MDE1835184.1 hypothetical protein [Euryarchaeota archaeon]MDE1880405.1 hypothetical protein [Euryarchaeota archaeon]MDE2045726.1 hypothetical protein [Thermoplasmata archaeon]
MEVPQRVALAVLASALLVGAGAGLGWFISTRSPQGGACATTSVGPLTVENETSVLGSSLATGSVQAFGANRTSVIFGGVSYYHRNGEPFDSLPAAEEVSPGPSSIGPSSVDLTARLSPYFFEGGIFPVVWNGEEWLIAGQTTVDNESEGAAVLLQGDAITNLTGLVGPIFEGFGIWIAGWDGSGWLLGGNSSHGAALAYLANGRVVNLTGILPNNVPGDWVQMIAWNGTGWLVGGRGVFGALYQGRYTDLLPGSPFGPGGVYAFDWDGHEWLASGSPTAVVQVQGSSLLPGPVLPPAFRGWVNTLVHASGLWIAAGGSYAAGGGYAPQLELLGGVQPGSSVVDLSRCLPGVFSGGWVQFGGAAPVLSSHSYLLVGEGGAVPGSFSSHAAAARLDLPAAG